MKIENEELQKWNRENRGIMKIVNCQLIMILIIISLSASAQVRDGSYKGAVVKDGKIDPTSDLTIDVLSLGNGVSVYTEKKNPLDGCYYMQINGTRRTIIANFTKGYLHGEWTEYMYEKVYRKGAFVKGKYDGKHYTYAHESEEPSSILTYKDGLRQHFISYHKNGKTEDEGHYDEEGKLHGEAFTYDETGKVIKEARYAHGWLHGVQMEIRNGVQEYSSYTNGEKDQAREHITRYPDGKNKEKGSFDDKNRKTGKWTFWNEGGKVVQEEDYLNGQLNGERKMYYDNGNIRSIETYKDNELNGKRTDYDDAKRISYEYNYLNGKLDGIFKAYNDGKLWRECLYLKGEILREKEYKNGKINVLRLIDSSGKLVDVQEYDADGNPVKRNNEYKKHASITLKEDASGIIDIE